MAQNVDGSAEELPGIFTRPMQTAECIRIATLEAVVLVRRESSGEQPINKNYSNLLPVNELKTTISVQEVTSDDS